MTKNAKKPYQPVYVHSKDGFQSTKFISDNEGWIQTNLIHNSKAIGE